MARPILFLVGLAAATATATAASLAACGPRPAPAPPADPAPPIDNTPAAPPAPSSDDPLGLAEGVTWRFRGSHTFHADDRGADVTADLTLTTVVLGEQRRDGVVTFQVKDWPAGALGQETAITIADGLVYLGDLDSGEPWVQLPLRDGGSVCEDDDSGYCWRVEAAGTGFDVVYRTNPDVTIYHLEPGRGVTRYEYHHNGTTNHVVLERVTD